VFGKAGGSVLYSGILTQPVLDSLSIPLRVTGIEYGWDYSLGCTACKNYLTATSTFGSVYTRTYSLIGTGSVATKAPLGEINLTKPTTFGLQFTGQQLWSEKQWQGPSITNPYYKLTYTAISIPEKPQQLVIPKDLPAQILETYIDPVKDALPKLVQDPVVNQVLENPPIIREYQPPTLNRGISSNTASEEKPKTTQAIRVSTQATRQAENKQDTGQLVTITGITSQAPSLEQYQQTIILDAAFYVVKDIYKTVQPVDNQRLLRGLTGSSNLTHGRLVDEQYRLK
jgi:hypothetical protein